VAVAKTRPERHFGFSHGHDFVRARGLDHLPEAGHLELDDYDA
jgi:hypothetical protein